MLPGDVASFACPLTIVGQHGVDKVLANVRHDAIVVIDVVVITTKDFAQVPSCIDPKILRSFMKVLHVLCPSVPEFDFARVELTLFLNPSWPNFFGGHHVVCVFVLVFDVHGLDRSLRLRSGFGHGWLAYRCLLFDVDTHRLGYELFDECILPARVLRCDEAFGSL